MRKPLKKETLLALYSVKRYLNSDAQEDVGLRLQIPVFFKDPSTLVGTGIGPLDNEFTTPWEPGLRDGPTSARFAVVDFDASSNTLHAPAKWVAEALTFNDPQGNALDHTATDAMQFHQQSVWAIAQNTLDYFESGNAVGRRISWAFDGGRLILVPHAGYDRNAYYDRASKSLQFYWFEHEGKPVYTCLSSDIVNHELAHAVLDGLRPLYFESVARETAAFHEFLGDITALLMAFRNNGFRKHVLGASGGDLSTDKLVSALAIEFGEAVEGHPYLRSALNTTTMGDLEDSFEPHELSEVLTGAVFDILRGVFERFREAERESEAGGGRTASDSRAIWRTVQRMQWLAIQPLDLLPPCDVSFKDYALAVLRHHLVSDPIDTHRIQEVMRNAFVDRGIITTREAKDLAKPASLFRRLSLTVFHPVDAIAASRGSAYRFIDDNRRDLFVPPNVDVDVAEVVHARKSTSEGRSMPEQIVVQYTWREDVALDGERFGRLAGKHTALMCGGTLVLDQNGNLVHWSRKPGSEAAGVGPAADRELATGIRRRKELLETIERRLKAGMIGETVGSQFGLLGRASPPFALTEFDGEVAFRFLPHLSKGNGEETGERRWQVSF